MTDEDVDKEQLAELVTNSKQYSFAPDTFRKIFYEVFGEDFDWFELFFNKEEYKSFALWYDEDTWYIYSAQFNITICWYKGLGRINQCTNEFLTEEGLRTFFIELRKDYEEETAETQIQVGRMNGKSLRCIEALIKLEAVKSASTELLLKELKDRGVIRSWYYNGSYHVGSEL